MPPDSNDEPPRWRMIEATNGYDADNSWFREPPPVPNGLSSRSRGGRMTHALARPLSVFSSAQRRRRHTVEPAGAWTRTGE